MKVDSLIGEIKRAYQINIENIELHREMIGKVYYLQNQEQKYMFKITVTLNRMTPCRRFRS